MLDSFVSITTAKIDFRCLRFVRAGVGSEVLGMYNSCRSRCMKASLYRMMAGLGRAVLADGNSYTLVYIIHYTT